MRHLHSLALLPVLCAILLAGCATPDPGQDALVIRAEQITSSAFAAIDNFLQWEHVNHAAAPLEATKFADKLRDESPQLIRAARALTQTYKANRTADNKANLETILATLETMRAQALQMLEKPAAALKSQISAQMAVAPAVVLMAIDGLFRLFTLIGGLVADAKRTKEWTPAEEAEIDAKMEEAFRAAHWKKK